MQNSNLVTQSRRTIGDAYRDLVAKSRSRSVTQSLRVNAPFAQWLAEAEMQYSVAKGGATLLKDIYGNRDEEAWSPAVAFKQEQSPRRFVASYINYLNLSGEAS